MTKEIAVPEDADKSERIIIPISKSMAGDIDEFWHGNRLRSKSEAVRRLIQAGLDAQRKSGKK